MQHRSDDEKIHAITLHPSLEQSLAASLQPTDSGPAVVVAPQLLQRLLSMAAAEMERATAMGWRPVLLCSQRVRRPIRRLIERSLPNLPVLAYAEITAEAEVEAAGMVEVQLDAA